MNFTWQVIFILISLNLCQGQSQYEFGNQVIVSFQSANVLTNQSNMQREIGFKVQFKKAFKVVPQVFISTQQMDLGAGSAAGFIIKVSQITTTGFLMTGVALQQQPIYALSADWFAFDDSRIKVVEYEKLDTATLVNSGKKKGIYIINHEMNEVLTTGIVSLTGVQHTYGNPVVEIKLEEITDTTIKVTARKYGDCAIQYLRFNVLLGTDAALWASTPQQFTFDKTHPFVQRSPSATQVAASADIPSQFSYQSTIPIVTIRGFDQEISRNLRLKYSNVVLGSKLSYQIDTWWDTSLYAVFHQAAIYIPKIAPPPISSQNQQLWGEYSGFSTEAEAEQIAMESLVEIKNQILTGQ